MCSPEAGRKMVGSLREEKSPCKCPLFFLFFAPVIGLFVARAFSVVISMSFPVFRAHRRPVNRLYFKEGIFGLHPCGETPGTGCARNSKLLPHGGRSLFLSMSRSSRPYRGCLVKDVKPRVADADGRGGLQSR